MPPVADIQSSPHEIDEGIRLAEAGVTLGSGPDDPSVAGVTANIGDRWYRTNGEVWLKTGVADTAWTLQGTSGPSTQVEPDYIGVQVFM